MGQNVVIFAGAGASKAINAAEFPTTREFFDRLSSSIKQKPLFMAAVRAITQHNNTDVVDIEQVLWALQEVKEFFDAIYKQNSVLGKLIVGQNIMNIIAKGSNIGHLADKAGEARVQIRNIISEINEFVYDLYSYEPTEAELSDNWTPVLDRLVSPCDSVNIFTTNYDVSIEGGLYSVLGGLGENNYLGQKTTRSYKMIDLSRWTSEQTSGGVLLTKLHGSINWKISGDNIYCSDPGFAGVHEKHGIIYPGFKGKSSISFFDAFHDYMDVRMNIADRIIFIGFAFRDDHINQRLRSSIDRKSKVLIINPDKEVVHPPLRASVSYHHAGFDRHAASVAVKFALGS